MTDEKKNIKNDGLIYNKEKQEQCKLMNNTQQRKTRLIPDYFDLQKFRQDLDEKKMRNHILYVDNRMYNKLKKKTELTRIISHRGTSLSLFRMFNL